MRPPFFDPMMIWTELSYTLIVVFLCFLIYFRTKEIYTLTKHKGIEYFRNIFLFFGLAYASRFLTHLFLISKIVFEIFLPKGIMGPISMILVGYLSTLGIFFMAYSVLWKKIKYETFIFISNIIATFISFFAYFSRSPVIVSLLQLPIIIFTLIFTLKKDDKKKKKYHTRILYYFIAIFWLISLFIMDSKQSMLIPYELKVSLQIISIGIFFFIFHRVSRWTK